MKYWNIVTTTMDLSTDVKQYQQFFAFVKNCHAEYSMQTVFRGGGRLSIFVKFGNFEVPPYFYGYARDYHLTSHNY